MSSESKTMMTLNGLIHFSFGKSLALVIACFIFAACATPDDPLDGLVEVNSTTLFDAPAVRSATPASQETVAHGKYLVELLGCGSCHTDGALLGDPNMQAWLAGSSVGIAYSNPLKGSHPGVVFPPNITPDVDTGVGGWSRDQLAAAIRAGAGRHGGGTILVMPWQAYAKLSDEDAYAMADYLKSVEPVYFETPENVPPGRKTSHDYVHFGVYWTR